MTIDGGAGEHRCIIPLDDGRLASVAHLPSRVPAPAIVCAHGLLSSKDSSKFVAFGERLSAAGYAVLRFDFTGCGESAAAREPTLIGTRLRDLRAAIRFAMTQAWCLADSPLGLIGSSFGGYLSLLAAAEQPDRIGSVVCWATPYDVEKVGRMLAQSADLSPRLPKGYGLGEPVRLNDLPPLKDVCVIHGRLDETVSVADATEIYRRLGEPRRLLVMEGADHRFLDPTWRANALNATLDWLLETLPNQAEGEGRTTPRRETIKV